MIPSSITALAAPTILLVAVVVAAVLGVHLAVSTSQPPRQGYRYLWAPWYTLPVFFTVLYGLGSLLAILHATVPQHPRALVLAQSVMEALGRFGSE